MKRCTVLFVLALFALSVGVRAHATDKKAPSKRIKVLVVSGGHPYQEKEFHELFQGYKDMDCTFVKEVVGGEAFKNIDSWPYDVIVLYNFEKNPPAKEKENFLKLLDRGVPLLVLHHGIYGYRPWPEFQKMIGVTSWLSGAKDGMHFKIHAADPDHPVTRGLKDFVIDDETYAGFTVDPKVHVLLTTDEPTNATTIAWTWRYRNSPVDYFQLGHDANAWRNEHYIEILGRMIRDLAASAPGGSGGVR